MNPDTLKYYFDRWSALRSCFAYRGPFMDRFTNAILDIAEQTRDHQQPHINRKVSFMLVECFQNILKHAESSARADTSHGDDGMFSFKYTDSSFVINSINIVRNEEVAKLREMIEHVNALDEKELKRVYLNQLEHNTLSNKGGAGLGLIELARKSGQKILYKIAEIDGRFSQFHQQITFAHQPDDLTDYKHFLQRNEEYYKLSREEDIFLHFKGDFTQKSILPILEMAQQKEFAEGEYRYKTRRVKHVLIEILQNMSRMNTPTGDNTQNPTLILGRDNGRLFVAAGNVVSMSEKMLLEEKLDYLLSLEEEELAELHRNTIRASLRFENKDRTGLGLIEVVKGSTDKVQYQFYPLSDNTFLFALSVKF